MKKIVLGFILLGFMLGISSCGLIFGGHINRCQTVRPPKGEPRRKIRPAALIADILFIPTIIGPGVALAVDFASGAIYRHCEDHGPVFTFSEIAAKKHADSINMAAQNAHRIKDSNYAAKKLFSITTDAAQYALIQPNIGIECKVGRKLFAGINFAIVVPSSLFAVNPVASEQYLNPGTVYSGYAIRLYFKLYTSKRYRSYWSVQGVFKGLSFNNVGFYDLYGDAYGNNYSINEKATTLGLDFLHGNELFRSATMIDVDLFYGVGIHERFRNYTVFNETLGSTGVPPAYEGTSIAYNGNYSTILTTVTPVVGLRIGFKYVKKK